MGRWIGVAALLCAIGWWRHRPRRHPMGGFRCERCGHAGGSLDDFAAGHFGVGYVPVERKPFMRGRGRA